MVRHIVSWNFKDGLSDAENSRNALAVKTELENLKGTIEGIVELEVHTNVLHSSNKDIVLNSLFVSEEALAAYQAHPDHKKVGELVAKVLQDRACIDYSC